MCSNHTTPTISGRPGSKMKMTVQEEYDALLEEYYRPYPPETTRITRRASNRKVVVRNRLNELARMLGLITE